MKQLSEERSIETSGGLSSNTFAIKTSPQAFQLLSSGLYTNKIQAVLRELACNAVDAHQLAGCPERPIEVKLPNALDKQFYVKDYGTGLNHDQVMRLYTTYFDSTKQSSNDFIGGFGVGSKSPFAYTDSFTVESRFNGEKRLYSAYVNEDGIPTIMQLSDEKTDEPNGLTIGFPVKPEDFQNFTREAVQTYKWFKVPPIIKGQSLKIENIEGLNLGNLWSVKSNSRSYDSPSYIRMGSVAYPVGTLFDNIDTSDDTAEIKECIQTAKSLLSHRSSWVVDLPIGSSLVAASREALQFDKKSVASLKNAIIPIIQDAVLRVHNTVSKNVSNIRDYYKNIEKFTNENDSLYRNMSLFSMLQKHNPNYHPDGIKVSQSEYPALKLIEMSNRHIGDFYSKTKRKSPALDADEIQRRVRRKITTSYNENGKIPDYKELSQLIWNMNAEVIKTWPLHESNDLQEIIDFTLADCDSSSEGKCVVIPADNATDADFKKDLDKLCAYLNIKTLELVKPVRPPKKTMVKTEDIYGVKIEKHYRNGDLSKLARQRMVTSTITTKIEPDSEYAYVVFDKKTFPNSKDDASNVYNQTINRTSNIKRLKEHELIKELVEEILPADGFIMIEKTDLPVFKTICPDSIPFTQIVEKFKKDTKIAKLLQHTVSALPESVSYRDANNLIKMCNNCKSYADKNNLDISETTLYKTVSTWIQKQELSDNTSDIREAVRRSSTIGTQEFGWPVVKISSSKDTTPEVENLNNLYPMLSMISYYNEKYETITNYILEKEELQFYKNNIASSMSI